MELDGIMPDWSPGWLPEAPRPIVPVPATTVPKIRGSRVIVGDAEHGWRSDLRADDLVVRDGAIYVPVLPELDYYRAELNNTTVVAPLVAVEQVWVEKPAHFPVSDPPSGIAPAFPPSTETGAPPIQRPIPSAECGRITGRRLVLVTPSGERRGLRAVCEPYTDPDGEVRIRVCQEPGWYQWALKGTPPRTISVPTFLVWAE